jgi:2-succinyl-5-enolpyruvyl-6-hydroxy-3-cyclohexene-1-carboxylate synthase
MLREPFFCTKSVPEPNAFFTEYGSVTSLPDARTISTWKNKIESSKNGVIIVGSMEHRTPRKPIYELARKLNWPIFSDIISGCRMDGEQSHQIPHFDPILKANQEMRPNAVLHFGDRFVSKTLLEWLNDSAPAFYGLAADHPCRHDPKHLITHRVSCAPDVLCNSLLPLLEDRSDLNWFEMWKNCANRATEQLKDYFQNESQVSEPGIFHWLKDHLPDAWDLFIANSMPIRDADNYYYPLKPSGTVFANRGISGIDGNIATSIGIARGLERPLLAVLGDLAVLHDLNSLAQIKKSAQPLILIIINNGGGGIFSFLPGAERTVHFEKFIAAAHALRFEHAAKLFDLPHYPSADWQTGISELLKQKKSGIIEITTHRGENHRLHQQLTETIKQACYQPV